MKIGFKQHLGFESRSDAYPMGRDFGFEDVVEFEHEGPSEELEVIRNHLGNRRNAVPTIWDSEGNEV